MIVHITYSEQELNDIKYALGYTSTRVQDAQRSQRTKKLMEKIEVVESLNK